MRDQPEAWQLLEETARRYLGMSAEEFVRKWQAWEFGDPDETNPDLWSVAMLLPLVDVGPWNVEPKPKRK